MHFGIPPINQLTQRKSGDKVNTENRPVREDYETYIEYKRALEHYIYWLGQEKVSMQMKLKDAIARHIENKTDKA